ncbi:MAG: arsenite methyltransferase [Limnohabitans sp.]|nr:arsenite methyltransferase [Limnohabitans sp.]
MAAKPLRVLFLCTGNSCRSQMAEGFARALRGERVEAYSAGTNPHGLNPLAVRAMAEVGIDISKHLSRRPVEIGVDFDVVVTVCDSAHESCPVFLGASVVHAGFDDPPRLARDAKSDDEAMPHYRRVRDEIRAFVETFLDALLLPNAVEQDAVRGQVREGYARIAATGSWSSLTESAGSCCAGGGCCGPATFTPEQLAQAIGYSSGELAVVPDGANMGLSCGNPTAIAALQPGETVLDLGAGGGFDCFIAGAKVGATGRVIGVDMTPAMLSKARANIAGYSAQTGLSNVEFRLGEIEHLPVADATVDAVISNCVINLSPNKAQVWREVARVLKHGGRVAISDLALLKPLPDAVRTDLEALVGCVAGAMLVEDMRALAQAAGLADLRLETKSSYIDAMTNWEDPLYQRIVAALPAGSRLGEYVTSLDVTAVKP